MKKQKGITLIVLIITIILMLILAGVVISLTLGENGLFTTAKYAVAKTEEEKAREKLELALVDLQAKKYTDIENYYDDEYIDNYLSKEGMIVIEDVVTVDGWKFSIDRSVPKIGESLGKGEESKKITLTANIENATDYTTATITVEIEYDGTIAEIKINGTEKEIPEKNEEGKYILTKEVDKNGKYTIYAKDENDEYKTTIVNVTEISEDLVIRTPEELVWFRDRVNKGATYSEKTITVANNIDLGKVCYKVDGTVANDVSWEPIGNYQEEGENSTHIFKGTFNGNYHTINNLYINSDQNYRGLFGYAENATITGVVIEGIKDKESTEENAKIVSIKGKSYVGAIAGYIDHCIIANCANNADIESSSQYVGGIIGYGAKISEIVGVYNKGNITGDGNYVGGIAGIMSASDDTHIVKYSYNIGTIKGNSHVGGILGCASNYGRIYNSYNLGKIVSVSTVGGITGKVRAYGRVTYCYNLGTVKAEGSEDGHIGGVAGNNGAFEGSNSGSIVSYSYNANNITSNASRVGGIIGYNSRYCKTQNCYISSDVLVMKGATKATSKVGTSSSYLGKLIGYTYSNTTSYVDKIGILSTMPSVYEVVNADEENGLNNGDSEYWSKTAYSNAEKQTPQLKWESNVK